MLFQKCDKDDGRFCPRFSKQMFAPWMVKRWNVAFRIGSFDPYVSCHLPIRSACNVWLEFVCGTCIQYIPYGARFSWLSLPMRKKTPNKTHRVLDNGHMESQINVFVCLNYLLSEDWFCLTTKTLLFTIVTTTALGCRTFFRLFVLCHFVQFVALAFFAKSTTLFWYVHLKMEAKNENKINKFV